METFRKTPYCSSQASQKNKISKALAPSLPECKAKFLSSPGCDEAKTPSCLLEWCHQQPSRTLFSGSDRSPVESQDQTRMRTSFLWVQGRPPERPEHLLLSSIYESPSLGIQGDLRGEPGLLHPSNSNKVGFCPFCKSHVLKSMLSEVL